MKNLVQKLIKEAWTVLCIFFHQLQHRFSRKCFPIKLSTPSTNWSRVASTKTRSHLNVDAPLGLEQEQDRCGRVGHLGKGGCLKEESEGGKQKKVFGMGMVVAIELARRHKTACDAGERRSSLNNVSPVWDPSRVPPPPPLCPAVTACYSEERSENESSSPKLW